MPVSRLERTRAEQQLHHIRSLRSSRAAIDGAIHVPAGSRALSECCMDSRPARASSVTPPNGVTRPALLFRSREVVVIVALGTDGRMSEIGSHANRGDRIRV